MVYIFILLLVTLVALVGHLLFQKKIEWKVVLGEFFKTKRMPVVSIEEVCNRASSYFQIRVYDESAAVGRVRHLCLNNVEHSAIDLEHPDRSFYSYTDYFHLPWIFNSHPRRILVIGLGGGILPMKFTRDHADLVCETVELDPGIVAVAREYFGFKEDGRNRVRVGDGRPFLQSTQNTYDLILMDAYGSGPYGPVLPRSLSTREFFTAARSRLTPSGVLAFNLIGQIQGQAPLALSVLKTAGEVFPNAYPFMVDWRSNPDPSLMRNIIVVLPRDGEMKREDIIKKAKELVADGTVKLKHLPEIAGDLYPKPLFLEGVQILTDAGSN